jgi:hypothetical protein
MDVGNPVKPNDAKTTLVQEEQTTAGNPGAFVNPGFIHIECSTKL